MFGSSVWKIAPGAQQVPLIIAHRGASSQAPENTMSTFKAAVEAGADAVELDVRLSKDQQVVIMHDRRVDRTTTGVGTVGSHTLEDLKALDAGSWFGRDYTSEQVPTLEEVFQQMPQGYPIYVEMKAGGFGAWRLAQEVARQISAHQRWESAMVASFNPLAARFLQAINNRIVRGYIWSGKHPFPLRRRWLVPMANPYWMAPDRGTLNPGLLRKLHVHGHPVAAWDMDASRDLSELMGMGLDGVVTDHPDVLAEKRRQLLQNRNHRQALRR